MTKILFQALSKMEQMQTDYPILIIVLQKVMEEMLILIVNSEKVQVSQSLLNLQMFGNSIIW